MHQLPQDLSPKDNRVRRHRKLQKRIDGSQSLSRIFALPAILLVLNMIDALMTEYGLSIGLREVNPLFSLVAIPAKFLGCIVLFATSYLQDRINPKAKTINDTIVCIVVILYLFVLSNNALTIIHVH